MCANTALEGRGARLEGAEIGLSRFSKEKLFVTVSEGTTGRVREVEVEESGDGDEERAIAVKEVIVLDGGTRRVGEEEV